MMNVKEISDKKPPRRWLFILLSISFGYFLAGVCFAATEFLDNFYGNIVSAVLFAPELLVGGFLGHKLFSLLSSVIPRVGEFGDFGIVIFVMFIEGIISVALFFGIFGALFWHGLYRNRRFLPIVLCILGVTHILSLGVSWWFDHYR